MNINKDNFLKTSVDNRQLLRNCMVNPSSALSLPFIRRKRMKT